MPILWHHRSAATGKPDGHRGRRGASGALGEAENEPRGSLRRLRPWDGFRGSRLNAIMVIPCLGDLDTESPLPKKYAGHAIELKRPTNRASAEVATVILATSLHAATGCPAQQEEGGGATCTSSLCSHATKLRMRAPKK